jgi:predicted CopG family antitoxin
MSKNEHAHKVIALSQENYEFLKSLGKFGQSFNDIISRLINERNQMAVNQ